MQRSGGAGAEVRCHLVIVHVYDARMHSTVVRHWWNGTWGRLARRDVYIRTEGRSWKRSYDELALAEQEAARHRDPAMRWTDISGAHHV